MTGAMRGRKNKTSNRPMKNCLYPVYPEDEPRIIASVKGRLAAFESEKARHEMDHGEDPDVDRIKFVNTEIRELKDLILRLEGM